MLSKKTIIMIKENIRLIKPGSGLHPKYYKEIMGKKFNQDGSRGEPFSLKMFK
jgi:pseudaminic acid synthase